MLETHSAWLTNTPGGKWDRYLRGKECVDELGRVEQDRSVKNMAYRLMNWTFVNDFFFRCVIPVVWYNNNMIIYIYIFSQHNYIFFLCVLQHYMFRPSVWAIIRCV